MSETLPFPPLPPGELPPIETRLARLDALLPYARAALGDVRDPIAVQATLACLVQAALAHPIFCGFYRRTAIATLTVGPYQGSLGCLAIDLARGVCGAAAREKRTVRVPDVSAFPGHIGCDSASQSELVIPVLHRGEVHAVLDIDSAHPDAFSDEEATRLESLLEAAFAAAAWPAWGASE